MRRASFDDWPGLAEAWGSPRHDLALKEASGEPAGRRLRQLGLDMGRDVGELRLLRRVVLAPVLDALDHGGGGDAVGVGDVRELGAVGRGHVRRQLVARAAHAVHRVEQRDQLTHHLLGGYLWSDSCE